MKSSVHETEIESRVSFVFGRLEIVVSFLLRVKDGKKQNEEIRNPET